MRLAEATRRNDDIEGIFVNFRENVPECSRSGYFDSGVADASIEGKKSAVGDLPNQEKRSAALDYLSRR